MVDLRTDASLTWLAVLARSVELAAGGAPWLVAGALARDLLLSHAHGIRIARLTRDVDIAVAVPTWEAFETIRTALIESGRFAPLPLVHKLRYDGGISLDLIPFGGLEADDRTIAWPPDRAIVMNVAGFREALAASLVVLLPEGTQLRVVSLPALVALKLKAWRERRLTEPGKDAQDFFLVLSHYLDAGQRDRLYDEAAHLLDEPDFDYTHAGARLLGADVRRFLQTAGADTAVADLGRLLAGETDPNQPRSGCCRMRELPTLMRRWVSSRRSGRRSRRARRSDRGAEAQPASVVSSCATISAANNSAARRSSCVSLG